MNPLAWGARVSPEFRTKVAAICDNFGWATDARSWLMACMAFESGETFRANVLNGAGSGAVGLIQFMPSTARGLGTTTEDLAAMEPVDQLEFVRRYFSPYYRRIASLPDMYMAILLPKYVGLPDESVLFSEGVAYRQNSGLDADHDGKITKREAAGKVIAKLAKGMLPGNVYEEG